MKKGFYVFLLVLIFYLLISTLFPEPLFVGRLGEFLGNLNFYLFGYLSYLLPFCLFIILRLNYRNKFNTENSLKVLGGVFLFFNFLFIQSLILKEGIIGNLFVNTLKDYIGLIGVSLLVFIFFVWSLLLIFEEKFIYFFLAFIKNKKEKFVNKIKKIKKQDLKTPQMTTVIDTDISNIELDLNSITINNNSKEETKDDFINKSNINKKK